MNYERLSLTGFINEMKDVTVGAHPRKFCFVLGAGTSRDSGIKSGQELVLVWDRELRERNEDEYLRWRTEKGITDKNMSSFYSQYYEKRFWRCPADGYNFIEKIMEQASPSVGYVMLAHMLTNTPHNVVITTNFDHLTEDAISYYTHETPLVIGHEVLAHYIEGQPVRPTIIKIHRDLLFDPKSQEEELKTLPDSWKKALGRIFENYHPVFIGYAGNDKSLMDFLVENGEKFADGSWKFPYWMLYRGNKIEGKVEELLEKSQGFYVEHEGFDGVMIALGMLFDYQTPTKDVFLRDAEKRYSALTDAIAKHIAKESNKKIGTEADRPDGKPSGGDSPTQEPEVSEELQEDRNSVVQAVDRLASQSDEQRRFREAMTLRKNSDYEKSTGILLELLKVNPENTNYLHELGYNYFMQDELSEAESIFIKLISIDENNLWNYYLLGEIFNKRKEYENAEQFYNRTLEKNTSFCLAYYGLGDIYWKQGRYAEALSAYEKCAELDRNWAFVYLRISEVLVHLDRKEEALEAINKAITLDSNALWYYHHKANILDSLGLHEEAKQERATANSKLNNN